MAGDILLAPSVLGADPLAVGAAIDALKGEYDWLHLDVMDGRFVRNLSFGPKMAETLRERYPDAFLDVHLMAENLDVFLPLFAESGASQISIHAEAESQQLHGRLSWIREKGLRAGVVLAPATPVEQIRFVLPLVDVVLVMSVTPGFGGQKLIESSLEKTRDLVRLRAVEGYRYRIEMDGGIKLENAPRLRAAGCEVFVMGSAVFGAPDPGEYLKKTRTEIANYKGGSDGARFQQR
jgi:ribulose-phosphate 3-epimerase